MTDLDFAADAILSQLDAAFAADDAVKAEEKRKADAAAELEYQLAREDIAFAKYARRLAAACHGRF